MSKLITCKVCKKEISSSAENCPECGHTHKKDRIQAKNNKQMIYILVFGIVFLALFKTGILEQLVDMVIKK